MIGVEGPVRERRWTKPRKLALEALFINGGEGRRSNTTNARVISLTLTSTTLPLVYWQSADWLLSERLVEPAGFDKVRLTKVGWIAGAKLWNVPLATAQRMMRKAGVR